MNFEYLEHTDIIVTLFTSRTYWHNFTNHIERQQNEICIKNLTHLSLFRTTKFAESATKMMKSIQFNHFAIKYKKFTIKKKSKSNK